MSFLKTFVRFCVLPLLVAPVVAQTTTNQAPSSGAAAGGQIVATGGTRLHGFVTDPDGAAIPGATITLTPAKGNGVKTESKGDGSYALTLTPGTYTVVISMPGFATYSMNGLKVPAVPSTTLDAKLKVGEQTTVVNVEANAISLSTDPDSNASATVISGKDLDALSDDPDELSSELSALAGPAAGPNGGQIYVDGFTGGQLPPKSSIREIRINQNPFSAEYDKLGFGRIEVFTKPGTDKFHGSLSLQGNDKPFNTSNPFLGGANQQPDYHTFFILGNLTGPMTKTSSFSIGGSRRTIQNNVIVNPTGFYSASPTATTPCAPGTVTGCANYGYPATARAVFQPQTRSDITPRLDFALGEKNVLTTRYQYEGGTTSNSGTSGNALPSTFTNTSNNEHTLQISDTQTISSKMVNETRFEYQRSESTIAALSGAASVSVQGSFASGGSATQSSDVVSTHFEAQNYTSYAVGKHFIRFGGRLRTTGEAVTNITNPNGSFTYNYLLDPCTDASVTNKPSSCAGVTTTCATATTAGTGYTSSYQCGTPSQFRLTTTLRPTVNVRETDLGAYVEDDWKLRPNLTFSYGLRYEAENRVSDHDLAPRVAVSYGIPRKGGKTSTVVRAGFGIFYDRISLGDFLTNEQLGTNPAQQQQTVTNPGATCTPGSIALCNASASARTTVYTLSPNLRSQYIMQAALGVDQQIGKIGTISVNYLPNRGNHAAYTNLTTTGTQFNYQYRSERVFKQQQLFVNGNIRAAKVNLFGFYALNFANSNTSGDSFVPTSQDPRVDYGRAAFATRNFGVIGGSYNAPYKFTISPFILARSGSPYNITTGTDVNGDSVYNDRPTFASGSSAFCGSASSFGTPAQGTSYTEIPINYCTGPAIATVNMRLSRTFGFGPKTGTANAGGSGGGGRNGGTGGGGRGGPGGGGRGGPGGGGPGGPGGPFGGGGNSGQRYNLTFGVQGQNIFNMVPYAAPTDTSALTSTQFGKLTQLVGRPFSSPNAVRMLTLQATFNF